MESQSDYLRQPATFRGVVEVLPDFIEVIETHISTVCLCGNRVFKVKKSVNLGPPFQDQRPLEARERLCRLELERNKRRLLCP
jgi:aminoglycoside phosphotransferase family enzyme